ncbi:MAG: UpxY family transcription antiterminator [Candidatus Acidiferrales bacterium]
MSTTLNGVNSVEPVGAAAFCNGPEPQWFAAYTCANHEKRVAGQLADRAIPCYLPLYESLRHWKDRKKRIERPLFPGYVFVQMSIRDRLRILQLPSVVRLVSFGQGPVAVPEEDIATIRLCLEKKWRMEPHPFLKTGQRVRVVRGALEGAEGILVRKKGMFRLVLSVGMVMRSVAVEIDSSDVEPIKSARVSEKQ